MDEWTDSYSRRGRQNLSYRYYSHRSFRSCIQMIACYGVRASSDHLCTVYTMLPSSIGLHQLISANFLIVKNPAKSFFRLAVVLSFSSAPIHRRLLLLPPLLVSSRLCSVAAADDDDVMFDLIQKALRYRMTWKLSFAVAHLLLLLLTWIYADDGTFYSQTVFAQNSAISLS